MSILEQRITKNKELFDVYEPDEGHFDRFQKKLKSKKEPKKENKPKRFYFGALKIAASVLILLAVTFVLFMYNNRSGSLFAAETPPELTEVSNYYSSVTEQKLAKIDELSKTDPEAEKLKQYALMNAEAVDADTKELEKQYVASNKDTRLFGAIVSNYRVLAAALDKVIQNMNDIQDKKSGVL